MQRAANLEEIIATSSQENTNLNELSLHFQFGWAKPKKEILTYGLKKGESNDYLLKL